MRIDHIYKKLKQHFVTGMTAQELSDLLGYTRANVSHELNKLVFAGKVRKVKGKPVRFYSLEQDTETISPVEEKNELNILNQFSRNNPSLYAAIEQAKAAILYPPNGMNTLILGETGVGKSMIVDLLFEFAKDSNLVTQNAELIVFNCADYANNPQLLLAQLFGSKKGAYTGLEENRVGLIEKAHKGILFLDEVHRLPPEGQEMFFTFIDKGTFRRMGETDVLRQADVRIFAATTEKPESHLLRTFTRRFPMVIRLPALRERTFQERINLVNYFMRIEAKHLNSPIKVSANSINAFMSYDCENNIGQLRADIKFSCANAYAEYISGKKELISVTSRLLPEHVKSSLLNNVEHRKIWSNYIQTQTKYSIYYPEEALDNYVDDVSNNTVYDVLHDLLNNASLGEDTDIGNVIASYFHDNYKYANKNTDYKIENLIPQNILDVVENIINFCETELNKSFRLEFKYALAKHLESMLDRVKGNKKISHPNLNKIRVEFSDLFNLSLDILRLIEKQLEITLPIDEAGFLAMIFLYDDINYKNASHTKVIVVMHGESAASSIANTANHLMGVDIAHGFNLPLDVKPQLITDNIIDFIKNDSHVSDVLLLVDMGSLTHIGNIIVESTGIKTRTLQLVSTLHVIEAVQKSISGLKIDDLYNEVLDVFSLLEQKTESEQSIQLVDKKLAILTVCISGKGAAAVLKKKIEESFTYRKNYLDVISVEYSSEEEFRNQFRLIETTHSVIAIVSPLQIEIDVPVFNVDLIYTDNGINELQQLIDLETTSKLMCDPLSTMLTHLSPAEIVLEIRKFIFASAQNFGILATSNMIIGITMHVACLFDKLLSFKNKNHTNQIIEISDSPTHRVLITHLAPLCKKYNVVIDNNELDIIAKFFKQSSK